MKRAALILADAEIVGTGKAAKNWGITSRSIQNYKRRLNTDLEFSRLFASKKQEIARMWAKRIEEAMMVCLDELTRQIPHLPLGEAQSVHVTCGAIKILGELKINAEVLQGLPEDSSQS